MALPLSAQRERRRQTFSARVSLCRTVKVAERKLCALIAETSVKFRTTGAMESHTEPETGHRAEGVCQRGCRLLLSGEDFDKGDHRCVDALRAVTDALEERSAALEHETRMARLRWNRREQSLLAQVSTLQNEAQLSALRYQRRLHQYMLHINSIAEQVAGYYKVRGMCLTRALGAN